jgi:hypothetical protein
MPRGFLHFSEYAIPWGIPVPGTINPLILVAPPKSGSSLLNELVRDMCHAAGQPFIDIPGYLFHYGFDLTTLDLKNPAKLFNQPGFCYGGFRNWPEFMAHSDPPIFTPTLFLMRDPRDMIVSAYFSERESHFVPDAGPARQRVLRRRKLVQSMAIDDYAIATIDHYQELLETTRPLWRSTGTGPERYVFRYEDVIYRKAKLAAEVSEILGLGLSDEKLRELAKGRDSFPEKEDPGGHIRQVHPGNHREKLRPETIEILTERFRGVLEEFGYFTD